MTIALVVGANGGIGSACVDELLCKKYIVHSSTSADLDLNYPERIFDLDLSNVDLLINCAGHTQGTYRGFLNNDWHNQVSQMTVNYISNIMLLKHYVSSRESGKYVWLNSTTLDNPRPFHSIYTSSKIASKFAIDLIKQEATHISILEAKVGLTKTNLRYRNFEGTKTHSEVDATYGSELVLSPKFVAERIVEAIEQDLDLAMIK